MESSTAHALSVTYSSGAIPAITTPGSFFLTHRHDLWAKLISFGEGLRVDKLDRQYAYWNHCGFFIGNDGTMVEALIKGVEINNISKYKDDEFTIVTLTQVSPEDVQEGIKFANYSVGEEYGLLTIAFVALWSLLGGKLVIGLDGQEICSQLVARCLERYGEIFPKNPIRMTPSDLAETYSIHIPGT